MSQVSEDKFDKIGANIIHITERKSTEPCFIYTVSLSKVLRKAVSYILKSY